MGVLTRQVGGRAGFWGQEGIFVGVTVILHSKQSLRITLCHVVYLLLLSSPAHIRSGVFGNSRPIDLVVLDPLWRRKIAGIILGLFDVLFVNYYCNQ